MNAAFIIFDDVSGTQDLRFDPDLINVGSNPPRLAALITCRVGTAHHL